MNLGSDGPDLSRIMINQLSREDQWVKWKSTGCKDWTLPSLDDTKGIKKRIDDQEKCTEKSENLNWRSRRKPVTPASRYCHANVENQYLVGKGGAFVPSVEGIDESYSLTKVKASFQVLLVELWRVLASCFWFICWIMIVPPISSCQASSVPSLDISIELLVLIPLQSWFLGIHQAYWRWEFCGNFTQRRCSVVLLESLQTDDFWKPFQHWLYRTTRCAEVCTSMLPAVSAISLDCNKSYSQLLRCVSCKSWSRPGLFQCHRYKIIGVCVSFQVRAIAPSHIDLTSVWSIFPCLWQQALLPNPEKSNGHHTKLLQKPSKGPVSTQSIKGQKRKGGECAQEDSASPGDIK